MKSGDFHYRWKLEWNGTCYRGYYAAITLRDVWWVPIAIITGPLMPAFFALAIYWLLHLGRQ